MPSGFQSSTINDDNFCPLCKRRHTIRKCRRFLTMPVKLKMKLVYEEDICKRCLGQTHRYSKHCTGKDNCSKCHRNHNTILHYKPGSKSVVLQMTAMVKVAECAVEDGTIWRIKLNPSQTYSTIAAWAIYRFASLANTKFCPTNIGVFMWPRFPEGRDHRIEVSLRVVDEAMERTPALEIKPNNVLRRLNKRRVADEFFWLPDHAPITLGADAAQSIYVGAPYINPALPMSQCTIFGWTFFGDVRDADIKKL